jgi:exosortase A
VSRSSAGSIPEAPPPSLSVPSATGVSWAWAALGLALLGVVAAFLHWDALAGAARTWTGSATYGYGMLVPAVVAVVLWRERAALGRMTPRPWPWGLTLVGAAAVLATVGQVVSALVVEQLALVAILQAAALTILGPVVVRRIAFPLLYLYLAVPIGDGLIGPLQEVTARFAVGLLEVLSVPVRLDGLLIRIPGATFHVAEACAGLRFLLAAVALGVLLAYLFFHSWWQRLLFVAASIAVAIVGNGLRAAGLVLIAHWNDLQVAVGVDHLTYGYAFTALLLACLVALAAISGTPRRPAVAAPANAAGPAVAGGCRSRILIITAAVLVTMALPALATRPAAAQCQVGRAIPSPRIDAPWRAVGGTSTWRPAAANPDAEIWRGYRSGDRVVELYVGFYCAQREGAEAVSQAHRLSGAQSWVVLSHGGDRLDEGAETISAKRFEVRAGAQRRLVYVWYWVGDRFTADPLVAKLLQAKATLFGGSDAAAVIVASSPYDAEPASARAAIEQALVAWEPLDDLMTRLAASAAR